MKKSLAALAAVALAFLFVTPQTSKAHTILKRPFQQRYNFKSVSCYACHAEGKDKDGKRLGKEVLNDLGKDMKKLLVKHKITDRLNVAKKADPGTKKKVHAAISKEFVESLKQLEKLKSPKGTLWVKLLKEGNIDGVTKKSKKKDADE